MNNKYLIYLVAVVALIVIVFFVMFGFGSNQSFTDYRNGTYTLNENAISFKDGIFVRDISGETKQTVRIFGKEVLSDFDEDGDIDVAFIISEDSGGSGTFYYVVSALRNRNGYDGTNAIFLGDRIAIQNIDFRDNYIIANYADRKAGEPFTAKPSMGISRYFKIVDGKLVESDTVLNAALAVRCINNSGTWNPEFKECLGVDKASCTAIGGNFNECASACRNNPEATICTLQCVQVCEMKNTL